MCMFKVAKVKNDLFSAKQNKFAKLNSTHGKGHQKKKKRKVTLILKKEAQCSSKRAEQKTSSHESEIEWSLFV